MGGVDLPSKDESKLAGSWAILGLEMQGTRSLVDHVSLRRNVYHSFLALVDYTNPAQPIVADEIHFGPRSRSGTTFSSRLMSEFIGRMGDMHMTDTFRSAAKATKLEDKLYFLKDMHYVPSNRHNEISQIPQGTYFQDYKRATNEVWNHMVSASEKIGSLDILFLKGIVNCRTGTKAVIESLGGDFITVLDDPDINSGQEQSTMILERLKSVSFHLPKEIKIYDPAPVTHETLDH